MCGLAGFFDPKLSPDERLATLRDMIGLIRYRGPDGITLWTDPSQGIALSHARLSIIDLEGGAQPVFDESGKFAIVFNGEIYNYRELKAELIAKGHRFYTNSDTEVILHLYQEEGISAFARLRGMFALAIWDQAGRKLVLARDPLGKKPLFYLHRGESFDFASEMKAFLPRAGFEPQLNARAFHFFLNMRWVPGEDTLLEGVRQVPPGHALTFTGGRLRIDQYWFDKVDPSIATLSVEEHKDNIRHLLRQAVKRRLVADVPVGIFLSGGLDSSAVLALMAGECGQPIKSFSLGFGNPEDETSDAEETARHFGCDHTNFFVDDHPLSNLRAAVWHCEIPKVNSIQLYLLAKMARDHVKVVMSGIGGDELFGGYDNYLFVRYLGGITSLPLKGLGASMREVVFKLFRGGVALRNDEWRRGLQMLLSFGDRATFYSILRNAWDSDPAMYPLLYSGSQLAAAGETHVTDYFAKYFKGGDFLREVIECEIHEKLVADQLLVEDRNMMAHGIEGRAPFLDVDLVQYALGIPSHLKIGLFGGRKRILKESMRGIVPDFVFTRKKKGFAFDPYRQFQRDLKTVAEKALESGTLSKLGLINPDYLRAIVSHPPSPKLHWHYWFLWNALGFAEWHDLFIRKQYSDQQVGAPEMRVSIVTGPHKRGPRPKFSLSEVGTAG